MWLTLKSNRINRAQVYSLTAILYHSLNGYRGEKAEIPWDMNFDPVEYVKET